jgi:DNA (cytosine-5)-methyltransferase 1
MVSFSQGNTLLAILEALAELGYAADVRILYAPHFGVPQTRWRTVVLGFRGNRFPKHAFPEPTREAPVHVNFTSILDGKDLVHLPTTVGLLPFTSVFDAIDDLPPLANGEAGAPVKPYRTTPQNDYQALLRVNSEGVTNHEAPRLSRINLERLHHIPEGGNWTDIPEHLLPAGMKRAHRGDHTKRYGRARADGLSSTILTKCDPHWGAYFHYNQDRAFTVREAARIQSFPDTYVFTGSKAEQYAQVGNAVPPLMAAAIGQSVIDALNPAFTSARKAA